MPGLGGAVRHLRRLPGPFRYVLWAIGIGVESGAMLAEDREAAPRAPRPRPDRAAPDRPGEALDPHHFAERFGLFLIILLGEVVVEAGQAAVAATSRPGGWAALVAAMVLAAALWWLYFDSAAEINLKVLELSGGSPTMARAIFAVGHMLPAFALLITAAGVGLLLEEDPPRIAYWLACVGIGIYVARHARRSCAAAAACRARAGAPARGDVPARPSRSRRSSPHAYLWLLTAWVGICAVLTTRTAASTRREIDRYLGGRARGPRRREADPQDARLPLSRRTARVRPARAPRAPRPPARPAPSRRAARSRGPMR